MTARKSEVIFLTRAEREKFIAWLRQEISADRTLVDQMKKLPAMEATIKDTNLKIAAKSVVADILGKITTAQESRS